MGESPRTLACTALGCSPHPTIYLLSFPLTQHSARRMDQALALTPDQGLLETLASVYNQRKVVNNERLPHPPPPAREAWEAWALTFFFCPDFFLLRLLGASPRRQVMSPVAVVWLIAIATGYVKRNSPSGFPDRPRKGLERPRD